MRTTCKDCDGPGICEHRRRRSECKECGGSQICEHGKVRSKCKDCGYIPKTCEHGKQKRRCKECKAATEASKNPVVESLADISQAVNTLESNSVSAIVHSEADKL